MDTIIAQTGFKVGGLTSLTTIDFPGRLAAIIFVRGCPWRCRYCHNASLLNAEERGLPWEEILEFLARRVKFLDGVVFSGGEPTFWTDLPHYAHLARKMGYEVAIHTNGAYPDRLERLLEEVEISWMAMDIKAPFNEYEKVCGAGADGEKARESAEIIVRSGIPYEFRTTIHPAILSVEDVLVIARYLNHLKAKHFTLQRCRTEHTLDPSLRHEGGDFEPYMRELQREFARVFPRAEFR